MKRRDFVLAIVAAVVLPRAVKAQKAEKKIPVIGLLWTDSVKPSPFVPFLVEELRERGWIVGRDFRLHDQVTLQGYEGYAQSVASLLRAKVDVIVTNGSTAATAAA